MELWPVVPFYFILWWIAIFWSVWRQRLIPYIITRRSLSWVTFFLLSFYEAVGGEDVEGPADAAAAIEMFCDWLNDSDLKVPFSRVFANSCLLEGSILWAMRTLASKSASGHMSLSIDLNFLTERSRFRARRFSTTNLARVEGSAFSVTTYGR